MNNRYAPQTKVNARPIEVNSNMPNGRMPCCSAIELTRMLVEVPISVQVPPSMAKKDSGIMKRLGLSSRT